MSFELLCMTMIGLLFGAALIFGGYRLFIVLLPIWGFSLASVWAHKRYSLSLVPSSWRQLPVAL